MNVYYEYRRTPLVNGIVRLFEVRSDLLRSAANQFKRIKTDRKSDNNYRIGLHSSVRPSKLNCVIVLRRTVAHPNAYPQTVNAIDGKNGYCTSCPVIITCSSSYALCKSLYSFTSHKRCNILSCACLFTKTTNAVFM